MNAKVLIYGKDPVLLQTRCKVLELAGLNCHTVTDLDHAVSAIAKEKVGAVVLCSSIPTQELPHVLSSISEVSRGQLKAIVVGLPVTRMTFGGSVISLESPVEPTKFAKLVRQVLGE